MSNDKRKKEPDFNDEREHNRHSRPNRKAVGRQASHYREQESYYPAPDKDVYLSLVNNILS